MVIAATPAKLRARPDGTGSLRLVCQAVDNGAQKLEDWSDGRGGAAGPYRTVTTMTQDDEQDRSEAPRPSLDNGDAARQVAHLTGMSPEAAETFAAFHSGRFAQGSAFKDAA
jgi:hypothetical protein